MSVQRLIDSKFWSDNFIVDKLNPLDRYLFLYFLTNEKTNIAGVYEIPLRTISNETGIEKEEILRMLHRLKGKVEYCDGWVYLVNFVKHQNTSSNAVKIGIEKIFNNLPDNVSEWVKSIQNPVGSIDSPHTVPIQPEVSNLIKSNLIKSNLIQEGGCVDDTKSVYSENFEEFWKEYPEKVGKGKAYTFWNKLSNSEQAESLNSIKKQKESSHFRGKDGKDYIPHPATWLNQRRWEDEIKEIEKLEIIRFN